MTIASLRSKVDSSVRSNNHLVPRAVVNELTQLQLLREQEENWKYKKDRTVDICTWSYYWTEYTKVQVKIFDLLNSKRF